MPWFPTSMAQRDRRVERKPNIRAVWANTVHAKTHIAAQAGQLSTLVTQLDQVNAALAQLGQVLTGLEQLSKCVDELAGGINALAERLDQIATTLEDQDRRILPALPRHG